MLFALSAEYDVYFNVNQINQLYLSNSDASDHHIYVNNIDKEKLCFTQSNTRIYWNRNLAMSYIFLLLTISLGQSVYSVSPPLSAGGGAVPNFEKGGIREKMSAWGDLKEFLPSIFVWGHLLCFFSKNTFKNKIWLCVWQLNFKCWSRPVLAKQPVNVLWHFGSAKSLE